MNKKIEDKIINILKKKGEGVGLTMGLISERSGLDYIKVLENIIKMTKEGKVKGEFDTHYLMKVYYLK
jgi:hypothetical protein